MKKITKISLYLLFLIIPLFFIDYINNFSSYYFLIPIIFFVGVFSIIYYYYTNKFPKNNLAEYSLRSFFNNFEKVEGYITIKFEQKKEVFSTINGIKNVSLDLTGYPFQIQYLIAYITRQFRYRDINNKLSTIHLWKRKFKSLKFENIRIKLIICTEENKEMIKDFFVVKNGYYKSSIITNLINSTKYLHYFGLHVEGGKDIYKKKALINEDLYQEGWVKLVKN